MPSYTKNVSALLDYRTNWSAWLAGDTIASGTATAYPGGLTITQQTITGYSAVLWVSGGTANQTYRVSHVIYTVAGRINVDSFDLGVK